LLLRFEGIAGNGMLRFNGHQIGILAPYTPHIFDVTSDTKPGKNKIEMELVDWQAPLGLGPAAAWEAWGGITYDAYAEIRTSLHRERSSGLSARARLQPRRVYARRFRTRDGFAKRSA